MIEGNRFIYGNKCRINCEISGYLMVVFRGVRFLGVLGVEVR